MQRSKPILALGMRKGKYLSFKGIKPHTCAQAVNFKKREGLGRERAKLLQTSTSLLEDKVKKLHSLRNATDSMEPFTPFYRHSKAFLF